VGSLLIRNARLPKCLIFSEQVDLTIAGTGGGVDGDDFVLANLFIDQLGLMSGFSLIKDDVASILDGATPDETLDLDNGIVLPAFVECHTHLDKGHIWARQPNPDGTFPGALDSVGTDRDVNWSAADVRARMEFALRSRSGFPGPSSQR
jgi:cytosine/creatinine deaminase